MRIPSKVIDVDVQLFYDVVYRSFCLIKIASNAAFGSAIINF